MKSVLKTETESNVPLKSISPGELTVISGPMFSGKSEELIKTISKLSSFGNKKVLAFKPDKDNRFSTEKIVSRNGTDFNSSNLPLKITNSIIAAVHSKADSYDVVAFDETQFYNSGIVELINSLIETGKDVYVAGLNLDYTGNQFGSMGDLLALADFSVSLKAFCNVCNSSMGCRTQRIINGSPAPLGPTIIIGDTEDYEVRCKKCYIPPHKVS